MRPFIYAFVREVLLIGQTVKFQAASIPSSGRLKRKVRKGHRKGMQSSFTLRPFADTFAPFAFSLTPRDELLFFFVLLS
jgi:hypothetical protein